MAFRLRLIEQSTESGIGAARTVQFGEAYLCELLGGHCEKAGVEARIVVVVQSMKLCKNAVEVYVAPVMGCKFKGAFSFKIKECGSAGIPERSVIDLSRIEMRDVRKLHIKLGQLGLKDMWWLDGRLNDIFSAGQWGE